MSAPGLPQNRQGPAMKLSPSVVRELALPAGSSEKTLFDDNLPAFGVRIRSSGRKFYVVQYRAADRTNRRVALGPVELLELPAARAMARELLAKVRLGHDPASERTARRRESSETFGDVLPRYLSFKREELRSRPFEEVQRHLDMHCQPLHDLPIELDRRPVATLLGKIAERSGPVAANRVRSSLCAFLGWAQREGLAKGNEALFTNKRVERSRDRVLTDAELAVILRSLDSNNMQFHSIVRLLLLTAARRDEIGGLLWSEVDLDAAIITISAERTKTKRPHLIPLGPSALAVLRAQPRRLNADGSERAHVFGHGIRGFQDWSGSKSDLDARVTAQSGPLAPWVLHDFRRVFSTVANERLGVELVVVESCLGHIIPGIAQVYNRADYIEQRRAAMQAWDAFLAGLVGDRRPVKLRKRAGAH